MIEIIGLTKKYGDIVAVDNLNLNIPAGTLFGFLGPNGAGKTTTIKIMTGLIKATNGIVKINGYDIERNPIEAKKSFGYVPDRAYLYEKLTAYEYIQFIINVYKKDNNTFSSNIINEQLEKFGLINWKDSLIESFSHGMKQRLLFASALIHKPKVLIIDEPLAGLDPLGIKLIREVLIDYIKKGNTVFMSTHSLSEAEKMCNLLGIINKGKLIALGDVKEIQEKATLPDSPLEEVFIQLTSESMHNL